MLECGLAARWRIAVSGLEFSFPRFIPAFRIAMMIRREWLKRLTVAVVSFLRLFRAEAFSAGPQPVRAEDSISVNCGAAKTYSLEAETIWHATGIGRS